MYVCVVFHSVSSTLNEPIDMVLGSITIVTDLKDVRKAEESVLGLSVGYHLGGEEAGKRREEGRKRS